MNNAEIRFTVYGDPVPKQRARTVTKIGKNGKKHTHSFTPVETFVQEQRIAEVYQSFYHGVEFEKGVPLRLSVDFFMKVPKSDKKSVREAKIAGEIRPTKTPDTDNLTKTVQDGLNGVAYEDDSQIVEMVGRKFYSEQPRTEIFIARIDYDQ